MVYDFNSLQYFFISTQQPLKKSYLFFFSEIEFSFVVAPVPCCNSLKVFLACLTLASANFALTSLSCPYQKLSDDEEGSQNLLKPPFLVWSSLTLDSSPLHYLLLHYKFYPTTLALPLGPLWNVPDLVQILQRSKKNAYFLGLAFLEPSQRALSLRTGVWLWQRIFPKGNVWGASRSRRGKWMGFVSPQIAISAIIQDTTHRSGVIRMNFLQLSVMLFSLKVAYILNLFFNWRRISLQYCVGFCYTTQMSHTHTHTHTHTHI